MNKNFFFLDIFLLPKKNKTKKQTYEIRIETFACYLAEDDSKQEWQQLLNPSRHIKKEEVWPKLPVIIFSTLFLH